MLFRAKKKAVDTGSIGCILRGNNEQDHHTHIMSYVVKHTFSPTAEPEVITEIQDLTESAFTKALDALPTHRATVVAFELDPDNHGYGDAFTARGEIYSIEPA